MTHRCRRGRDQQNAWPVVADGFLALLAVVTVMASGRQPVDHDVERFKSQIEVKARSEFALVIAEVESRAKWSRLVFTEDSLSFPKCRWSVPPDRERQMQALFRWIGSQRALLRQIRIEGHADRKWEGMGCKNVGPFLDNLQLSQNRARAVYNMLLGLEPEDADGLQQLLNDGRVTAQPVAGLEYMRDLAKRGCLEVAGYGDRHPRDPSDPDSPKNRRVEVVLEFRERATLRGDAGDRFVCGEGR